MIMAKFVKNPSGTVHSVADDFELPGAAPDHDGWSEVTEAEASPQLLGAESDPAVDFTELRDTTGAVVEDSSAPQETGETADAQPVEAPAPDSIPATLAEGEPVIAAPEVTA